MFQTKELIILVFLFLGSAVSLRVDITPAHGEISVGESKFFLCEVMGGVKGIDWFSPSGEKIETNRQDITVFRNDETSSTLTIYNANVDSAGTYKCVGTSGDQQAEATVNVKIYQKITFKNAPSLQEFTEGDSAVIVCDVISSPPPTVIWKHKRAKIQYEKDVRFKVLNNNHLQIRGIKKTDEGVYTCEGRIMARGEIDFRAIRVVVNVLPTIRVRQAEVNATADLGHSAMLACDADGFPEPTVTWTRSPRSDVLLESGDKYGFNEDGSEMTIMNVKKLDEGDYTCIARNKAGKTEEEVSLRVFVKPRITYLENHTTTEMEEQITLTCEATGDPTPTITWSYGTRVFTEGEQEHLKRIYQASWTRPEQHKSADGSVVVRSDARVSSLTLKYAQYTDAGQYLCTARNAVGESSQHMYLEVRYAPKILGSVAVYTWEGNPANISCEILAHPSEVSIVWLRDGLQLPNANTSNIKIYNTPSASYLEVNPDSQNDFGSYNCTASNEIGTESKEFILIQADVPSAPVITQVEPYSSTAQLIFDEPEASGGVPVLKYRAEWRAVGRNNWVQRVYEVREGLKAVTITGLKPETQYEAKMSAINGKGEGESSSTVAFKTEPVQGEPTPPKLEGTLQPKGNALRVNWIKQDDGGSPITHYLVRYKAREESEWKPEIRLPSGSEYVLLSGLEWDTEYDVFVVAENQQGKSQPGTLTFRTSSEPDATPDSMEDGAGLNTGVIVGILILVCVLLLLAVDATCCFLNKCGLLMCLCGKPGTGSKGKDIEAGKAAFVKDESKEPIVEVRTEDGLTANHDAGGHSEPNETTPLTEPERLAEAAATVVDLPLSVATNSDTATDTFDLSQSSPVSESTTLTSSITAPLPDPKPATATGPETSTPKSSSQPLANSLLSSDAQLVDLAEPVQTEAPPTVRQDAHITSPAFATQEPPALSTEKSSKEPEKEPQLNSFLQNLHEPVPLFASPQIVPSVNHELQLDGGTPQASETHLPQDGSHALGTAGSSGPSAPKNEKISEEEKSRSEEEEELKKLQPEAMAPNAISQTNDLESMA
ncbi:neural cell adhesion molecule 1b isoform X1 [Colossoma macropomum]|uniref:neural cell adhesion molecule 1b isoform X1 n=1 Tax=Colossoma macropomum TaxID=42526 RepID=UPI00186520A9|nr:neural cell adhesion molecule 1b isoform X1 [Colossoma macropomum]